jgi:hypothetical protein
MSNLTSLSEVQKVIYLSLSQNSFFITNNISVCNFVPNAVTEPFVKISEIKKINDDEYTNTIFALINIYSSQHSSIEVMSIASAVENCLSPDNIKLIPSSVEIASCINKSVSMIFDEESKFFNIKIEFLLNVT